MAVPLAEDELYTRVRLRDALQQGTYLGIGRCIVRDAKLPMRIALRLNRSDGA